jgi:hypothetical protein
LSTGTTPCGCTYYGGSDRTVHILADDAAPNGRWDSLCGRKQLDIGTPTRYRQERVPDVATCERCLGVWTARLAGWQTHMAGK